MGMRFNPPPGWPPVPEGWVPPDGWLPDPSWPAAPYGWPLWVDDASGPPVSPPSSPAAASPGDGQLPMHVKGQGGQIAFDGRFVTILRKGFLARATLGKGEKRLPVKAITGVQWKPAGPLVNGFIQFTVPGGNEVRGRLGSQTANASKDENSVVFTKAQQPAFEQLRAAVEDAIAGPL